MQEERRQILQMIQAGVVTAPEDRAVSAYKVAARW